jgi:hypothetical protein
MWVRAGTASRTAFRESSRSGISRNQTKPELIPGAEPVPQYSTLRNRMYSQFEMIHRSNGQIIYRLLHEMWFDFGHHIDLFIALFKNKLLFFRIYNAYKSKYLNLVVLYL